MEGGEYMNFEQRLAELEARIKKIEEDRAAERSALIQGFEKLKTVSFSSKYKFDPTNHDIQKWL
jgi:hypothetical protein